jgi:Tat protein translocase TatC
MTTSSELPISSVQDSDASAFTAEDENIVPAPPELNPEDEIDDVEMSFFDHLEELRLRIFYALIAVFGGMVLCFWKVNWIVKLLEQPAQGAKFLQLAPGEYFFVSIKVAGYSGILIASPMILYQIARFVLPGLTRRERRFLGPIVFGSSILFALGLSFAYIALIPAALNFFIQYGGDVVEQLWSIDRYFVAAVQYGSGVSDSCNSIVAGLGGDCVRQTDVGSMALCFAGGRSLRRSSNTFYRPAYPKSFRRSRFGPLYGWDRSCFAAEKISRA